MISKKRFDSHCETSSTIHYSTVWSALLPQQRKQSLKTSQLTLSCLAHFLSASAIFLFLLSYCLSLCASIFAVFGLSYTTETDNTEKHIIPFDEQISLCQFIHLLQHRADMIRHNVVCLPLCNSLGYLEAATLNTNLLCSVAVLLPLHRYLTLLDVFQT